MPPKSESQRRAMRAAASGDSTLGIPPSVGKDFSNADPGGKLPERASARSDQKPFGGGGLQAKLASQRKGKKS